MLVQSCCAFRQPVPTSAGRADGESGRFPCTRVHPSGRRSNMAAAEVVMRSPRLCVDTSMVVASLQSPRACALRAVAAASTSISGRRFARCGPPQPHRLPFSVGASSVFAIVAGRLALCWTRASLIWSAPSGGRGHRFVTLVEGDAKIAGNCAGAVSREEGRHGVSGFDYGLGRSRIFPLGARLANRQHCWCGSSLRAVVVLLAASLLHEL